MIEPGLVRAIAEQAARQGWSESAVTALRGDYPGVHLTYCLDDDVVGGVPVLTLAGGNVYLVDGRDHCPRLTDNHIAATGLVLARCAADGVEGA